MEQARSTIPIICIVGYSNVGKTTLLEKLLPELKRRGYRIATIKHHGRPGFEIDQPGKDTWRHAQAGSEHVVIVAPDKVASIRRVSREPTLDEIAATISDVDLILVEGYKQSDKPKIEVFRAACSQEPLCTPEELLAFVADVSLSSDIPCFNMDNITALADLIETRLLG